MTIPDQNKEILPEEKKDLPPDLENLESVSSSELWQIKQEMEASAARLAAENEKLEENISGANISPGQQEELERIDSAMIKEEAKKSTLSESGIMERNSLFQRFKEEISAIYEKARGVIEKTVDILLVKPGKFVWQQMKEHPVMTIAIILALAGLAFYNFPVLFGASAMTEEGVKVLEETLQKTLGPEASGMITQDALTELMNLRKAAP